MAWNPPRQEVTAPLHESDVQFESIMAQVSQLDHEDEDEDEDEDEEENGDDEKDSPSSRSRTVSLTLSEIDDLDPGDIEPALEMLEKYGLPDDGVETVTEAQKLLRQHLKFLTMDKDKVEVLKTIQDIVEADLRAKENLENLISHLMKIVARLPSERLEAIKEVYPDVENLAEYRDSLRKMNAVILVAGETGSGKSSLLNLLLGELGNDVLPVAHLSSTSVICEIKYGAKAELVAYPKDPGDDIQRKDLSSNPSEILTEFIYQDREDEEPFPYRKVEVMWPCEWLKGGVSLVDSPGIGESDELTNMVKDYIHKASGFIYVINTENAGGVHPDRLQSLLFSHLLEEKGNESNFDPSCAIFLCNKCDMIPREEKSDVEDEVLQKLKKIWPKFEDRQAIFTSVKQITDDLKDEYAPRSFKVLLEGINRLIPVGLKSKLIPVYLKCIQIINRCLVELKYFISQQQKTEEYIYSLEKIKNSLGDLEKRARQIMLAIGAKIDAQIEATIEDLEDHFNDGNVRQKILHWEPSQCPKPDDSGKIPDEIKTVYANKRIQNVFNEWDNEERLFEKIQDSIAENFQDEYMHIRQSLTDIENYLGETEANDEFQMEQDDSELSPLKFEEEMEEKTGSIDDKVLGMQTQVWVPLGMVMNKFGDQMKEGWKGLFNRQKEEKLAAERARAMEDMTRSILDNWLNFGQINYIVKERFTKMQAYFTDLVDTILVVIDADRKMIERLQTSCQTSETDIACLDLCTELYDDTDILRDQVNFVYYRMLHKSTFTDTDFEHGKVVGYHQYGISQLGTWKKPGLDEPITVLLKKWKEPITVDNVTSLLQEENNLKKLYSPNVVSFYGSYMTQNEHQIFGTLVLEYCDKTLDKVIFSPRYQAPGKKPCSRYQDAKSTAAEYGFQIAKGLKAIHNAGFLHRNLQPQTVLVASDGRVKLADLGAAKAVSDVTGSIMGAPLYSAPEVLGTDRCTEKADMFSLGMVMWELWYGQDVHVLGKRQQGPRRSVLEHWADSAYPEGAHTPPEEPWQQLMERCWSLEPASRPTAHECVKILHRYIIDNL